jgi:uncharacterized protein (DUF488 family)
MSRSIVHTIGHSTHQLDYFLELLQDYSIDCLLDVRSMPASAYNPQFNKEVLYHFLKSKGIEYLHFGKEFGARHTAPGVLDEEGKVDFELIRKTPEFISGVQQVIQKVKEGRTLTLMCSESDPMECHRFSMISVAIEAAGIEVWHILKDKSWQSNADLEQQLLKKFSKKIPHPDLFQPDISVADQLKAAYRLHNKEVAYSPTKENLVEKND